MALDNVSLNKFLNLLRSPRDRRIAMIRRDARTSVLKEKFDAKSEDRDFYSTFWADAKKAVFMGADLDDLTRERIEKSRSRFRLFPILRDGFLMAWDNYTGQILGDSEKIEQLRNISGAWSPNDVDGKIRVGNLLALKDINDLRHLVFPYFSQLYALGPRAASLGLWTLRDVLKVHQTETITIFDVLHGEIYSDVDIVPTGSEKDELSERYRAFLREWLTQKRIFSR